MSILLVSLLVVTTPEIGDAEPQPGNVDLANLDMVPLRSWGVSGINPETTQTESLDVLVWDFVQIGNRMFVGGAFLNVQESKNATPESQPYVAAFDVATGDWIETWRPSIDRAVYSLENLNGMLIVGGEFEQVNGVARTGLVALDPVSGEIDPGFAGQVQRPWSEKRAMVRTMRVVGTDLYLAGNFSHVLGANDERTRFYKAARLHGSQAVIDTGWKPEVTGSGVWGIDVDSDRGEVHLAGFFSAVNGEANTGNFHTVDSATGASEPGKIELPRNYARSQPEMFDVTVGDNSVWVIGEQHIVQTLRASDHQMIAYNHTGYRNDGFDYSNGFAGGAYQVGARIGDYVFAGCHCTYSERFGTASHFSSVSGRRTAHRLVMAYDAGTAELVEAFKPDIHSPRDGTWAIEADTNGCLWLGGDFHVGGADAGTPRWLGGFGRICPDGFDPTTPPPNLGALVGAGSAWRFDDTGADLGTAWRNPDYNDAGWATGQAEFGFGEGDENTPFTSGHLTYYARHSFEFSGDLPSALKVLVKADDGAVVYLNGTELVRDNMPSGPISSTTQPAGWKGGADEVFVEYIASADALVAGTNVLAVEVHNWWSGNSDLSLDLALEASDEAGPPPDAGPLVAQGSDWNYIDDANGTPNGWKGGIGNAKTGAAPFGFGENDLATQLPSGNAAYYFTQEFTVSDAEAINSLILGLRADDGAVVYLNGNEVHRVNMPAGAISWATRPSSPVWGDAETMQDYTIDTGALLDGNNVVAVEVHNYWSGNSDLSFDLSLE